MTADRCPNCHQDLSDPLVTACPHCGADLERLRELMQRSPEKQRFRPGYLPTDEDKARWDRRSRWVVGLLAVGFAVWVIWGSYRPKHLTPRELPRAEISAEVKDRCQHRPRCLVVYLGAWCRSCESAIPMIKTLNEHLEASQDVGLQVVLAADQAEDLRRMTRALGPDLVCFVDKKGGFGRHLRGEGFRSVPTFFLVDQDDRILKHVVGAHKLDAMLRKLDLRDP